LFPILKIKPKAERSVEGMHPWIFSGALENHDAFSDGQIVQLVNSKSIPFGYGWYQKDSEIRVKVFHFSKEEWKDSIDTLFIKKFENALRYRKVFLTDDTKAFRLIFGESDSLPGLIVDVYSQSAVVQTKGIGQSNIIPLLKGFLKNHGIDSIYIQNDEKNQNPIQLEFSENGLIFESYPMDGQKTGFFLDQRENRNSISNYARGKRVINVFSYTGGFGLYALRAGAEWVVNVDISQLALDRAKSIYEKNKYFEKAKFVNQDGFEFLTELQMDPCDIMILDPPAFSKSHRTIDKAARGYKEINRKAISKLKSGSILYTFSCSQNISRDLFRKIVFAAAKDAKREVLIMKELHQGWDHPIHLSCPETEYLKGYILYIN
jgi:23S rRNA (cytosine1962-C5)-methyltransferase